MKKILVTLALMLLLGCNMKDEVTAANANLQEDQIWIFAQFNVPEEKDQMETYYYYGLVSESLYNAIANNALSSGFIQLKNVKFWGDNNLIYDYKDIERSGQLIFRIEHIVKLNPVNVEPIVGKGFEQFEDPENITPPVFKEDKSTEESN
ncbi:hypothetical protein AAEU29_10110 [Pseudoalteromonas sp. SSM20]|uniref:hypothetical protein n=1 Tax=Pseudoalteromonas sp. SSM20 TaxID=3139394 RepID=UPI003BAA6E72